MSDHIIYVVRRWFESYEDLLFEYILMYPQRRVNKPVFTTAGIHMELESSSGVRDAG